MLIVLLASRLQRFGRTQMLFSLWIKLRKEDLLPQVQRRKSVRMHNAVEVISSGIALSRLSTPPPSLPCPSILKPQGPYEGEGQQGATCEQNALVPLLCHEMTSVQHFLKPNYWPGFHF